MFHFLEHVPKADPHLIAAKRLLTDYGDLVVQVPNADSYQARLFKENWVGYDVPRHLVNYSAKTLCHKLSLNEFKVIRQKHFVLRDNPSMLVCNILPALYPPGRAARRIAHVGSIAWLADLLFLATTVASIPLTALESIVGRGATVMIHAKPIIENSE
jgi:hypothetical protein